MNPPQSDWFHDVVSALAYSFATPHTQFSKLPPPYNDLTQFILTQRAQMPDYLRAPMKLAALGFDCSGILRSGKSFHRQSREQRARQINAWKNSSFGFQRDFIRYFESLATFSLYSRLRNGIYPEINHCEEPETDSPSELRAEIVVIGSGPGGAITACLLAEAGRDVLLLEEGSHLPQNSCEPFSKPEMLQKYRNGGQTVAFGKNKIAYVEGRCVGGGSEINSGLYHRTPPEILERWRKEFQVAALTEADLLSHFAKCESDVSVSPLPGPAPLASLKLHEGATRLGWKSLEIPRWFRYDDSALRPPSSALGKRQSMTETFIPRFLKAGGRLQPQTRALRIRQNGSGWLIEAGHRSGSAVRIASDTLFVCAGAIHTPALLRRSGITRNVGNALQMHPTVKVIAQFPDEVNADTMGVPVHQVKEFSPRLSFGCSVSSPAYLALGLIDHPDAAREVASTWPQLATYYAMITSEGSGSVQTLPGFCDPLVRYTLTETDRRNLADGLKKLGQLLFEAGATKLYPALTRGRTLSCHDCLDKLPDLLPDSLASLMTIHLFSSCPMGEDKSKCATDSFGRVHGFENLFVNDASLLCTAPAVNPQGSIMAIARRNALKLLGKL
ncbi:MAG TPA: GMC family oxidoreductase [Verrucomicrobiae bacterium]|nr:GMC family oxidoreductase [Verrucomicrobiae bacterium]